MKERPMTARRIDDQHAAALLARFDCGDQTVEELTDAT
jgi:hypothetical protein